MKVIGAIDKHGRCKHYHSERDIVAIQFRCCKQYYGCYYCHEEHAGHEAEVWEVDAEETSAILCGACGMEMSISAYLGSGSLCPNCSASFNPRCSHHYHYYFAPALIETSEGEE